MIKYIIRSKKWIGMLLVSMMIFSLIGCSGGKTSTSDLEGNFKNTLIDEDNGDGFQPVDEFNGYGQMIFNADGSGKWEYALETDIEWKLKGDKLTIVERFVDNEHGEQEESYQGTWDGEKVIVDIWGYKYLFEKIDSLATSDSVDTELVGTYQCTGSDMQGTKLDPSDEWLELSADGKGKWFLGATEDNFEWALDGNEINFDVEVSGQTSTLQYKASVEGEEIVLDTGMLYYFIKNDGSKREIPEGDQEQAGEESHLDWDDKASEGIVVPSDWYGVAEFTNVEGFDFEEIEYNIWGEISIHQGRSYIEIFKDPDGETYPILSMYINEEETGWLTPVIGEGDAWITPDPNSNKEQLLNKDDEWGLLTEYKDGSLDIYHIYNDDEGGYADCRLLIQEIGRGDEKKE